jgi:DNA repair exonuclease SbcCD ATPase subunit
MFSYGDDNALDLNKNPLTQIVGGNGNGKSSIALILEEVLFNKNSKGIKKADILNRNLKPKLYWISLDFSKGGDEYTIKTTRGGTQSVKLYKNGEDISGHTATSTYATIQDLVGCDHKTFTQIVYQSSSASLEFLTATDSNRKKFLIELLNLNKYVEAGEVFKGVAKELNERVTATNAKISSVKSWIDKYSKTELVYQEIEEVPEIPTELVEELQTLRSQLKDIDEINKKRSQNLIYKESRDSIKLNPDIVEPEIDLAEIQSKEALLNKTVEDSNNFIRKLNRLGSHCPTCEQQVDTEKVSTFLSEQTDILEASTTELEEIKKLVQVHKTQHRRWEVEQKNIREYERFHTLYDPTIPEELLDIEELNKNIKVKNKQFVDVENLYKQVSEKNNKASAHNAKVDLIKGQLEDQKAELDNLELELEGYNKRLNIVQILVKTFSSTGLIAYKIECLIKDLEDTTNKYLTELSSGRFQLTFRVESDKLNVIITDNGKEIEISALSSGERARVNAAALLGIRKLMQSISNNRINLLILDETIENLDLEGKEKLVEVLLQEDFLNTFLISHSFSHPLLERVYVSKENNESRIEN